MKLNLKDDNNKKLEEVQNLKNVLITDPNSKSKDKNTRTDYLKDLKDITNRIAQINGLNYDPNQRNAALSELEDIIKP